MPRTRSSQFLQQAAEGQEEEEEEEDEEEEEGDEETDEGEEEETEAEEEFEEILHGFEEDNYLVVQNPQSNSPIVLDEDFVEEELRQIPPPLVASPGAARLTAEESKEDSAAGTSQGRVISEENVGIASGNQSSDAFSCPICMEPWSASGVHRTCCLPCGHLYGRSCIERWIRQCKKSCGKCPQCNKKSKLTEIRNLYVSHIVAADEDLEKEVMSLRSENEFLKKQNAYLDEEVRLLKKRKMEREVYEKQKAACLKNVSRARMTLFDCIDEGRCFDGQLYPVPEHSTGSQNNSERRSSHCNITLKDEFGVDSAQVFDIDASSEILVVSRRPSAMNGVHVLTKISLLPPYENDNVLLPADTKAIRDVHISHPPGRLALLASLGRKLSIFSMESNNLVLTYDLPAPAWSCSWDLCSPHHVYAGLQNGMLMMYDLRQTARPMQSSSGLTSHPIHTVLSLGNDRVGGPPSGIRTLLTASSIGPCEWNFGGAGERPFLIPEMENQGVCISLAYCGSSNDIIATFRPKVQFPNDTVGSQSFLSQSPTVSRSGTLGSHVLLRRVGAGSYQSIGSSACNVSDVRMPRSAIIDVEDNHPLFAFGDETTHAIHVRELPSLGIVNRLNPHLHPILDIKYAHSTGPGLLGCISENKLQIFTCSRH